MSIILDPAEPVAFQPGGEEGPTYFLRVPKVMDRARYPEAVAETGAAFYSNPQIIGFAKESLKKLLTEESQAEDLAAGLAGMDAYLQRLEAAREAVSQDKNEQTDAEFELAWPLPDHIAGLLDSICEYDLELARKCAKATAYWHKAGIVAARMFMTGWDREDPFRRGLAGPTDDTLALIPDGHFVALAIKIRPMLQPPEARMGNSASPSSGQPKAANSRVTNGTRRKSHSPAEPEMASA